MADSRNRTPIMDKPAEPAIDEVPPEKSPSLCWAEENRAALDSSNAYVEQHGLPLARHRMF